MKKDYGRWIAGLLLMCASTAWAGEVRWQTYAVGTDFDAQGQVTSTQIDKQVPASIAALLASSVRQWQFAPTTRDGKPVPAHTFVQIRLRAAPNASGHYGVRISYAGNGPRMLTRTPPPKYPPRAVRAHQSELILLNAIAQPDGHLSDMVVTSRFKGWPLHSWFENSLLAAAKHWRFEPEMVDGTPVPTRVRIPVNFTLAHLDFTPEQIRTLHEAAAKQNTDDAQLAGTDVPLPSEETVALDSPLKPSNVATLTSAL
jgi:TonB family protein